MKVTCPSCGAGGSISLFIADADARKAVLAAAKLPSDCGTWVLKYIALFAPQERFLTTSRAAKLITECCDMIIDGVDFDRDHIKAPSYVWRQAMMQMLEQQELRRPIKNHHYLLRIVQSILTRRNDIDQSERAANRRLAEPARIHTTSMQPISEALPDNAAEQALPEVPIDEEDKWHTLAREALIKEGFNPKFVPLPIVAVKAKEMYADAQS